MEPNERTIVIPESIEIDGHSYVVKETPALMEFRQLVEKAEKNKLYSTFATLRQQINDLKATQVVQQSAPFDLGALVEALKGEFATREDLQDIVSKAVQPVNNNLEQRRQQELAEYRERLIKDNEGKCIPELVKGATREEIDASMEESIALLNKYHGPFIDPPQGKTVDPLLVNAERRAVASGEVLEIPAKPTPVKDDGKSPIPVVPTRAMPEVSTAPTTRKMTMEEFAQQREAILRNLEAEYGAQ